MITDEEDKQTAQSTARPAHEAGFLLRYRNQSIRRSVGSLASRRPGTFSWPAAAAMLSKDGSRFGAAASGFATLGCSGPERWGALPGLFCRRASVRGLLSGSSGGVAPIPEHLHPLALLLRQITATTRSRPAQCRFLFACPRGTRGYMWIWMTSRNWTPSTSQELGLIKVPFETRAWLCLSGYSGSRPE